MTIATCLFAAMLMLADPATQPTTRPFDAIQRELEHARQLLVDAEGGLVEVQQRVAAAEAQAGADFDATDGARAQQEVVAKLHAEYEAAKQSGTTTERLEAGSRWNTERLKLERERARFIRTREGVAAARTEEATLAGRIQQLRGSVDQLHEEALQNDPIQIAIRRRELVIGMTLEQAELALGPGRLIREGKGVQEWEWDHLVQVRRGPAGPSVMSGSAALRGGLTGGTTETVTDHTKVGIFRNGVLIEHSRY